MAQSNIKSGLIPISDFNTGGLAFSKWAGIKNSLYKFIGFDPHSQPGTILVEQKLTLASSTVVTEFCKCCINSSNGIRYWFSADSGKIWQDKAGTFTLVYTVSPAAGAAKILGAAEYQGYMYFATQSRLHRIATASADGSAAWTANAVPNWATFTITDLAFHPMINHSGQQILYIGDGNYLAQVDAGVFSANALDVATPLRIKSLGKIGTDILIGTYVSDNVTLTEIIRWNGWSLSFTNSDSIPEVGINAFLPADNMVLVQAGNQGNIYYYDGTNLELYMRIPGTFTSAAYGEVYPDSVANRGGQLLFGFSNGSSNPADQLVYRIGRYNRDYPYILDAPYPISQRSGTDFVVTGVEIGGMMVSNNVLYVAWKNGTSYGVDKYDTALKLDGAYFETRIMTIYRDVIANFGGAFMAYSSLPASTAINFYTSVNYAAYGSALTKLDDTQRCIVHTHNESNEFNALQLRVKITVSSNSAPQIEYGAISVR